MRTRPSPRNFKAGELAPWLDGLANELTGQGCRTLENFIVKKQGAATQRPGTFYAGEVKDSANKTILIPVVIDDDNRYILELGDAYIRFWNQATHAVLGAPYEVTSPWSSGDLADLCWQYLPSDKAILFAHPLYQTRKLSYTSGTSWDLGIFQYIIQDAELIINYRGVTYTRENNELWVMNRIPYLDSPGYGLGAKGKDNYIMFTTTGSAYIKSDIDSDWVAGQSGFITIHGAHIKMNQLGEGAVPNLASGLIYYTVNDGLTWAVTSTITTYAGIALTGIGYNPNDFAWRCVGYRSATTTIGAYSYDLKTWVSITETCGKSLRAIDNYNDLWIAVGSNSICLASTSEHSFYTSVTVTGIYYDITHGKVDGSNLWVAVGSDTATSGGCCIIDTSPDGTTWTRVYSSTEYTYLLWRVMYIGNEFITIGGLSTEDEAICLESQDGITWTANTDLSGTNKYSNRDIAYREDASRINLNISFPKNITLCEGRLIAASLLGYPSTIKGSKSNNFNNFRVGTDADDSWSYNIASSENVDIQWILGGSEGLVVGTRTAEGILIGSTDTGITPTEARFQWLSTFGSNSVKPVRIHDTIVFIQRGGEIVRGYKPVQGAWQSQDLTELADHIASGGITQLARQDDPLSIVYAVRNDGQLLALTYDVNIAAWSRIKLAPTAGSTSIIESIAVIPTSGAEDEIWCVVRHDVGGASKRYIEYFDTIAPDDKEAAHYVDCGVYETSGTTFSTIGSLTHIAGENVDALIDGVQVVSGLTVAAAGTLSILPYSGTEVHVGLPYTSYLQTMRSDYGSPWGAGAGLNRKTSNLYVWVHNSLAIANFGPTTATCTEDIVYSSSTTLNTEMIKVNFPGQYDRDNYIWCTVRDPRPFTLVAILPDTETGDE